LAFGSNSALKRTGFQPAAYLGRYAVTRVVGEANVWRLK